MTEVDTKLYLCSKCYRKCLWSELSPREHLCLRCRVPTRICPMCYRVFEPRDRMKIFCKRCAALGAKDAWFMPPPPPPSTPPPPRPRRPPPLLKPEPAAKLETEMKAPESELFERWQKIKTLAGIKDDCFPD